MPTQDTVDRAQARNFIAGRKIAYQAAFGSGEGRRVLDDLETFCRAGVAQSTFHSDPRGQAAYEGRREVYNRIRQHLELDLDTLFALYTQQDPYGDTDTDG